MPAATGQDRPNGAFFDTVRIGQLPLRFARASMAFADLVRDLFAQFRVRASLNVDPVRDGLQMRRVHARWLSAQVINVTSVGNRTIGANVGLTVGEIAVPHPMLAREHPVSVAVMGVEEYVTGSAVPTVVLGPEFWSPLLASTMTSHEAERLTFDPAEMGAVSRHEKGESPAPAGAELVGFFPFSHNVTLSRALT